AGRDLRLTRAGASYHRQLVVAHHLANLGGAQAQGVCRLREREPILGTALIVAVHPASLPRARGTGTRVGADDRGNRSTVRKLVRMEKSAVADPLVGQLLDGRYRI